MLLGSRWIEHALDPHGGVHEVRTAVREIPVRSGRGVDDLRHAGLPGGPDGQPGGGDPPADVPLAIEEAFRRGAQRLGADRPRGAAPAAADSVVVDGVVAGELVSAPREEAREAHAIRHVLGLDHRPPMNSQ